MSVYERAPARQALTDLFGAPTLVGLQVKLDRPVDRERPCCVNICAIAAGKGPHAGELICARCGQHRGWLSQSTARWIESVMTRFGAPTTPIVVRGRHTQQEEAHLCRELAERANGFPHQRKPQERPQRPHGTSVQRLAQRRASARGMALPG